MAIGPGFVPAQLPTGQEYFKLPFNELLAGLSAKQTKYDKGIADIDKMNALAPEAGYGTEKDLETWKQKYQPKIDELTNKILTTGEYNPAMSVKLSSEMVKDPLYSKIKKDYEYRPQVEAMIRDEAKGDIIHFRDANGNILPMVGNTFDPSHYGRTPYADPHKYVVDNMKILKPITEKVKEAGYEWDNTLGSYVKHTREGKVEYIDDARLLELLGPEAGYVKSMWESRAPEIEYFKASQQQQGLPPTLGAFSNFAFNSSQILKYHNDGTVDVVDHNAGRAVKTGGKSEDKKVTPSATKVFYGVKSSFSLGKTAKEVEDNLNTLKEKVQNYEAELSNPMSEVNMEFSDFLPYIDGPLALQVDGQESSTTVPTIQDTDGNVLIDTNKLYQAAKNMPQNLQTDYSNKVKGLETYNQNLLHQKNTLRAQQDIINNLKEQVGFNTIPEEILDEADKVYKKKQDLIVDYLLKNNAPPGMDSTEWKEMMVKKFGTPEEEVIKFLSTKSLAAKKYYEGLQALNETQQVEGRFYSFAGYDKDERDMAKGTFNYTLTNILAGDISNLRYRFDNKPVIEDGEDGEAIQKQIQNLANQIATGDEDIKLTKAFQLSGIRWDKGNKTFVMDLFIPGLDDAKYANKRFVEVPLDMSDGTHRKLVTSDYNLVNESMLGDLVEVSNSLEENGYYKATGKDVPITLTSYKSVSKNTNTKNSAIVTNYKGKVQGMDIEFKSPIEAAAFVNTMRYAQSIFFNPKMDRNAMFELDGKIVSLNRINEKEEFVKQLQSDPITGHNFTNKFQAELLYDKLKKYYGNFQ